MSAFLPDTFSVTVADESADADASAKGETGVDARGRVNGAGVGVTEDDASAAGGDQAAADAAGKSTGASIMAMICRSLTHAGLRH